ncbi:MAG: DNA polymerase III subunit beta [Gammaproteobacteria bacterium]
MKFTINREQLLIPLQQIVNVIEKRQTMPILSNVLLKTDKRELTLTGSDLEVQLVAKLELEKSDADEITVPARKFLDICRLLPGASDISIELQQNKFKVSSGRSRFSLSTLDAENYPKFNENKLDHQFSINSGLFKQALNKTVFCMANQDVRYYLNGLMLNISNQKIKMVASDGHRLSIYESELEKSTGYEATIVIPRKGVIEFLRLIDNLDDNLDVQFSGANIKVTLNYLTFSAKLIDAKYPDFNKVFQQDFLEALLLPKLPLKDALTRVAILSNEKFKGVSLEIQSGNLKISTQNPDHEEAEEDLPIEYEGDPMTIAFNAQYLLDAVSNVDSENVSITIAKNGSCSFIEDPQNRRFKFIVMPMRL